MTAGAIAAKPRSVPLRVGIAAALFGVLMLALGLGLGGAGTFGALLHMLNNGLTKGVLFLSAANIHRAYGSKSTDEVSGALYRVPISGALLLAGFSLGGNVVVKYLGERGDAAPPEGDATSSTSLMPSPLTSPLALT